jgi:hypothetical protein
MNDKVKIDLTEDLRQIYTAAKNYREEGLRQTYNEQRAEARACGYEFPDFEEWLDPSLTRRRAADRVMTRRQMDALEDGYDLD